MQKYCNTSTSPLREIIRVYSQILTHEIIRVYSQIYTHEWIKVKRKIDAPQCLVFLDTNCFKSSKTERNKKQNNPLHTFCFFFICKTFISNARLKLAKNQPNAKQHPEAELLLFENYSHSLYTLSSRNNGTYSLK